MTQEEYKAIEDFKPLRMYGARWYADATKTGDTALGSTHTISKTVRPFKGEYDDDIAKAAKLDVDAGPYVRPTGTQEETIWCLPCRQGILA